MPTEDAIITPACPEHLGTNENAMRIVKNLKNIVSLNDTEADDIGFLLLLQQIMKSDKLSKVSAKHFVMFGNPDIRHAPNVSSEEELDARYDCMVNIFGENTVEKSNARCTDIDNDYIHFLKKYSNEATILLHTASFKSLLELVKTAEEGELTNLLVLTYGSVNLDWAISAPKKPRTLSQDFSEAEAQRKEYEQARADYTEALATFYENVQKSGVTLLQFEGFPAFGNNKSIIEKNALLTHRILATANSTPIAQRLKDVNDYAVKKVRTMFLTNILNYFCKTISNEKLFKDVVTQLTQLLTELHDDLPANLFDNVTTELTMLADKSLTLEQSKFLQLLDAPFDMEQHKTLVATFKRLQRQLTAGEYIDKEANRSFHIFSSTSAKDQFLFADQAVAIILAELLNDNNNGENLLTQCGPVVLNSIDEHNFRVFCPPSKDESAQIFTMDMRQGIKEQVLSSQEIQEEKAAFLKHLNELQTFYPEGITSDLKDGIHRLEEGHSKDIESRINKKINQLQKMYFDYAEFRMAAILLSSEALLTQAERTELLSSEDFKKDIESQATSLLSAGFDVASSRDTMLQMINPNVQLHTYESKEKKRRLSSSSQQRDNLGFFPAGSTSSGDTPPGQNFQETSNFSL